MSPGEATVASHGIGSHPAEPPGLEDAAALGDVLQDGLDLLRGEPGVEEGRPLTFGETDLAGAAAEHPFGLAGPVAMRHGEVSGVPLGVVGAVGIQAAEARQVVHVEGSMVRSAGGGTSCVTSKR